MPWNMNDYPTSMKNLAPLIRKKAIDIGNALKRMATLMIAPFQLRLVKRRNGIKRQVQQTKRPSNKKQILRNKIRINRINMRGNY